MGIEIHKIFNANVYLNGTLELIGRASEIKLPEVAPVMSEHKGLGLTGTLELPAGLSPLTLGLSWAGFYADHLKKSANPFVANDFQIRASHEVFTSAGRAEQRPLIVLAKGTFKKSPLGSFKPQEASSGYDDEIAVSYLKLSLAGEELLEVDVFANIWRVDGVDVLETYRTNIAG